MPETLDFASLSDLQLVQLIHTEGDLLPRGAADEIIRRGASISGELIQTLQNEDAWDTELPEGWAVVHAAYLLAAIKPPGALEILMNSLEKADEYDVPQIIRNSRYLLGAFGPAAVEPLKAAAMDTSRDPDFRVWMRQALAWIAYCYPEAAHEVRAFLQMEITGIHPQPGCKWLDFYGENLHKAA